MAISIIRTTNTEGKDSEMLGLQEVTIRVTYDLSVKRQSVVSHCESYVLVGVRLTIHESNEVVED